MASGAAMNWLVCLSPYLVLIAAGFVPNEVWRVPGIAVAHGLHAPTSRPPTRATAMGRWAVIRSMNDQTAMPVAKIRAAPTANQSRVGEGPGRSTAWTRSRIRDRSSSAKTPERLCLAKVRADHHHFLTIESTSSQRPPQVRGTTIPSSRM
jgi:hypothetical protein